MKKKVKLSVQGAGRTLVNTSSSINYPTAMLTQLARLSSWIIFSLQNIHPMNTLRMLTPVVQTLIETLRP